jgi:hypothetical protein
MDRCPARLGRAPFSAGDCGYLVANNAARARVLRV